MLIDIRDKILAKDIITSSSDKEVLVMLINGLDDVDEERQYKYTISVKDMEEYMNADTDDDDDEQEPKRQKTSSSYDKGSDNPVEIIIQFNDDSPSYHEKPKIYVQFTLDMDRVQHSSIHVQKVEATGEAIDDDEDKLDKPPSVLSLDFGADEQDLVNVTHGYWLALVLKYMRVTSNRDLKIVLEFMKRAFVQTSKMITKNPSFNAHYKQNELFEIEHDMLAKQVHAAESKLIENRLFLFNQDVSQVDEQMKEKHQNMLNMYDGFLGILFTGFNNVITRRDIKELSKKINNALNICEIDKLDYSKQLKLNKMVHKATSKHDETATIAGKYKLTFYSDHWIEINEGIFIDPSTQDFRDFTFWFDLGTPIIPQNINEKYNLGFNQGYHYDFEIVREDFPHKKEVKSNKRGRIATIFD